MFPISGTNIGRLILESVTEAAEKRASVKVDVSEIRKVSGDLEKIAELPYKEDVYSSVQGLVKIASKYLEDSANELDALKDRNAELEKAMEMRSVIDDMVQYGILDPDNVEEKVAELSKKSSREIEITKTAVDMMKSGNVGSDLFEKTASVASGRSKRGMFDSIQF